jgi:hypothetical protein
MAARKMGNHIGLPLRFVCGSAVLCYPMRPLGGRG